MNYLRLFWRHFKKAGRLIGDFVSGVVLFVFYYTIFALFAIPFRFAVGSLQALRKDSSWISKEKNLRTLDDFRNE